jgi:serine/threonine protein phosphatase PrpC
MSALQRRNNKTAFNPDLSLVQMLYEQGHLLRSSQKSPCPAEYFFPCAGLLTAEPKIDIAPIDGGLASALFLICTDGLSDYLTMEVFKKHSLFDTTFPKRLSKLVGFNKKRKLRHISVIGVSAYGLTQGGEALCTNFVKVLRV